MKVIIYKPLLLFLFLIITGSSQAQEANDEFLFAIVEIVKTDQSEQYDVDIKLARVIPKRIKIPTRSDRVTGLSINSMSFEITDDQNRILDNVIIQNPLMESREYVNEDGKLARKSIQRTSRSILIRRPISKQATHLSVKQNSAIRSSNPVILKFR